MPFINFPAREINCKLVYYGPGLGGKTANLQWIYEHTGANQKGKMVSLATETDRTLFFDFLPLDLGSVRGFRTRFHLYTVPGQVFYDATRKLVPGACVSLAVTSTVTTRPTLTVATSITATGGASLGSPTVTCTKPHAVRCSGFSMQ